MIDKLKTETLLSKNAAEKLKIMQIKDEHINAINSKNLVDVDNIIEEYKDVFEGIGKLKDFELTLLIDKSAPPAVQPSRRLPYNVRQKLLEKLIELEDTPSLLLRNLYKKRVEFAISQNKIYA